MDTQTWSQTHTQSNLRHVPTIGWHVPGLLTYSDKRYKINSQYILPHLSNVQ